MKLVRRSRLATLSLALALAAVAAAGCGSSEDSSQSSAPGGAATTSTAPAGASAQSCTGASGDVEGLRVTGVSCDTGRDVLIGWTKTGVCSELGVSHPSCTVSGYRCLGAHTDRGVAVSCARPGRSISFIAKRG